MKIEFYPCFEYLKRFNNIYLYADPHFSDVDTFEYRKDYIGDEEQLKRINSKVGKKDAIIILGDLGNLDCVKKIRGYKILVMGNHEKGKSNYLKNDSDKKYLFDEVYEGVVTLNEKILLSHERVDLPFIFNIHGHDHSSMHNDELHLNLCAEHIDYTPVSLKKLIENGALKAVESIHRLSIERAKERKKSASKNKND